MANAALKDSMQVYIQSRINPFLGFTSSQHIIMALSIVSIVNVGQGPTSNCS